MTKNHDTYTTQTVSFDTFADSHTVVDSASHIPPSGQIQVLHVFLLAKWKEPIKFTDTSMWSRYLGKPSCYSIVFSIFPGTNNGGIRR